MKNREDINIPQVDGNIIIDTSIFTKVNDYIDVDKTYDIFYS
jgi:hypothetical protein